MLNYAKGIFEIGGLTLFSVVLGGFLVGFRHVRENLQKISDQKKYLIKLRTPAFDAIYHLILKSRLDRADRFFGQKLFSAQSFYVCWSLSIMYSIGFFLFSWLFGGAGSVGELSIFSTDIHWSSRLLFVFIVGITSWIFVYFTDGELFIIRKLLGKFPASLPFSVLWIANVTVIGVIEAVIFGVGFWFYGTMYGILFLPGLAVITIVCTLAGALAWAGNDAISSANSRQLNTSIFSSVVFMVIFLFFQKLNVFSITMVLFFGVLPFLNATLDWLSWAFSRFLGRSILEKRTFPALIIHATIDVFLAVVLLIVLTSLMTAAVELVNKIAIWRAFPGMILHLEPVMDSLHKQPFGEHRWITAMLLSTLLPTVLHLTMVLFAMITNITPKWFRMAARSNLINYCRAACKDEKYAALQDLTIPAIYFTSTWVLAIALFVFGCWGGWYLGAESINSVVQLLWQSANWTLQVVNGLSI